MHSKALRHAQVSATDAKLQTYKSSEWSSGSTNSADGGSLDLSNHIMIRQANG